MTTVTNYLKHGGLKQLTSILSLWGSEIWSRYHDLKIRYLQGFTFSRGHKGPSVPCFFQLLVDSSILWLVATCCCLQDQHLQIPLFTLLSSVCVISLCLSVVQTHVMVFRVYLDNPGLSPHLKILSLITLAKFLPCKVKLMRSRNKEVDIFWEAIFQLTTDFKELGYFLWNFYLFFKNRYCD